MPKSKTRVPIPPFEIEVWCPCCQKKEKEPGLDIDKCEDPACLVDSRFGATLYIEDGEPWELTFSVDCVKCECSFQISISGSGKWTIDDIDRSTCKVAQKG